jgi:hypothetical protein
MQTFILRFRDLVTEDGGTIQEHQKIIREKGEVWWGWWMRQYESSPLQYFHTIAQRLRDEKALRMYLMNSGANRLFKADLGRVLAAPRGNAIGTPEPTRSPSYYHRGKYPAWFLLTSIEEVQWHDCEFYYESFPSRPEKGEEWLQLLGQRIISMEQVRHIDVTLCSIIDRSSREKQ